MVAIIAPRLAPADMMVRHIASHTSMNESGPEASAPTPRTGEPFGPEGREIVADAAALLHGQRGLAQMGEDRAESSPISPMTKQLNSVTRRSVPAPDRMRPAGWNRKSSSAS